VGWLGGGGVVFVAWGGVGGGFCWFFCFFWVWPQPAPPLSTLVKSAAEEPGVGRAPRVVINVIMKEDEAGKGRHNGIYL